ncbi:DUF4402 domain-containing protein [Novosphingobium sp. FSW06-99]|uniref:DUF4402 domain-containing protein n=1 Tax=Novosphingobium sp. FSW06-99 TaxID=1739113 RepID=UPI00076D8588|nr:DUF4402 domain-containing protein [Novosphingobium sp. FSW06-99]KUR74114.1 hypothetical protein AQZ49_19465 [Novosphingobium sp. FSW06-99]
MKQALVIFGAGLAVWSGNAFAATGNTSASAGSSNATVIAPIVLSHTGGSTLNFGKFTVGSGGTVVVSPAGAGSTTGGVTFVPGSTNTADAFSVKGDPSRNFSVSTTGGNVSAGSTSMPFTTLPSATQSTLGTSGTGTFTVGSTLTVGSTIVPGTYTGTYTATVTYD